MAPRPETITAISTVVIALAALVVSLWQGIIMRRDNRLSVTPSLRFDSYMYSSKLLCLINSGLGPAIIEKLVVKVDGKDIGVEYDPLHAAIEQLGIKATGWITYMPSEREVMGIGEQIILIEQPEKNDLPPQSLREKLRRLEIQVFYQSRYGNRFMSNWTFRGSPS